MPSHHSFWINRKWKNCHPMVPSRLLHFHRKTGVGICVGVVFTISIFVLGVQDGDVSTSSHTKERQCLQCSCKGITAITPLQMRMSVLSKRFSRFPTNSNIPLSQWNWGKLLYQLESPRTLNKSWVKAFSIQSFSQQQKVPIILEWTTATHYNTSVTIPAGQTYLKGKCPVSNCVFTDDRSMYLEADVIIFPKLNFFPKAQFPSKRLPHQYYVFVNHEAPVHPYLTKFTFNQTFTKGFFNWTATYRLDSDIYTPVVLFLKKEERDKTVPRVEYMGQKYKGKKLVAWFVSHCETHSKREEYVQELQKYININIYGKCGDLKCERDKTRSCYKLLDNYWFYLSFESSLCMDYLTEKVMFPMRYAHVVPVVFGGANYSKILPAHSFIDITDFVSPKALAEYLIQLTEDEDRYTAYFNWKGWYRTAHEPSYRCQICSSLHQRPLTGQVYTDFTSWWNKDMCDINWVQRNKVNW